MQDDVGTCQGTLVANALSRIDAIFQEATPVAVVANCYRECRTNIMEARALLDKIKQRSATLRLVHSYPSYSKANLPSESNSDDTTPPRQPRKRLRTVVVADD